MSKVKNSFVAIAGLSLVIGSFTLITPAEPQGKGGNQQPLNVNVVNNPSVKVTDLYPAQPFQRNLTVPVSGEEVCVSVPEGKGLIIELVTARAYGSDELDHYVLGIKTTAGEARVTHGIVLQKQQTNVGSTLLAVTQSLRAYADSGSDVCFVPLDFDAGPTTTHITFSGQLVAAP